MTTRAGEVGVNRSKPQNLAFSTTGTLAITDDRDRIGRDFRIGSRDAFTTRAYPSVVESEGIHNVWAMSDSPHSVLIRWGKFDAEAIFG
jgi:hypothetical protein